MAMSDEAERVTLDDAIADALVPDGHVLTHFVIIGEYMAPDGERFMFTDQADTTVEWQRQGLLHNALFEYDWEDDE
jgi:hypothetical protein